MFKRSIPTKQEGKALAREDYMSEKAAEIFSKKYISSFSETQRTIVFAKSMITKLPFEDAKHIFFLALNKWLENQVHVRDASSLVLGMKLAPVLQGVKVKLVITALFDEPQRYRVTFYTEEKNSLAWTTFTISVPLIRRGVTRFTMQLTTVANYVHERMSPQGAGNRVIMRHAFGKAFKSFVAAYNEAYAEQLAQKETK